MKKSYLLLLALCFIVLLVGCKKNEGEFEYLPEAENGKVYEMNEALEGFDLNSTDGALGILANYADEMDMTGINHEDVRSEEYTEERSLVVPFYKKSTLRIYTTDFDENYNVIPKDLVYEKKVNEDNYALDWSFFRGEAMPQYILEIEHDKELAHLTVQYNGNTGTPRIEYIVLDEFDN